MDKIILKKETIEDLMNCFPDEDCYEAFMMELMTLGETIKAFNDAFVLIKDDDVLNLSAMRMVVLSTLFFRRNFDTIRDLVRKIEVVTLTPELKEEFSAQGVFFDEDTSLEAPEGDE